MSRARTAETADLPPGIIIRKRPSGNYYYYQTSSVNEKRREYPLGSNKELALTKWRAIASEMPPEKRRVGLRPWVATELLKATRASARRRGLDCTLTADDVQALVEKSKGKCALTGIPFDLFKDQNVRVRYWAPSIDRINCKQGYSSGNVRLVANAVNIALSDFGEDVLVRIAKGIVKTKYGKVV